MEPHKLTSERTEQIVNLLRDNPGVSMTLADIADQLSLDADELAANLTELEEHNLVIRETTDDGFDTYRFPDEYQRGTLAP